MKKSLKKVDIKKMTRLATAGVFTLAFAILVGTAWFIARSLGQASVAENSTSSKPLKVEGVNATLLDKVQKFMADRSSDANKLGPAVGNPFAGGTGDSPSPAPSPAPPPSAAQPSPSPTPSPAPSPAPAPSSTPPPST